jgi:hypothetical protein
MRAVGPVLMIGLVLAGQAHAQTDPCSGTPPTGTVYNPQRICFGSPDHATATGYAVEYWLLGVDPATGAPVQRFTLPVSAVTSVTSGYTALLSALEPLPGMPTGTTYVVRMTVSNTVGESTRSLASNPFAYLAVPQPAEAVSVR